MNYLYQITLIGISIVTSEALSQAPFAMNYLYQITLIGISIVTSEALSQAPKSDSSSRRDFVARSFFGLAALPSTPVFALKERDETLCKTGFFTNIWEFRCTDIGDISDEGTSRDLSSSELGATDSLMSKLNIGSTDTDEDLPTSNKNQIKSLNQDSKVRDKKRLF